MNFKNIKPNLFTKIFWMLCSLKLAVLVILSLAIALATATIIESLYDTPTAQYWVYRSLWFHGILFLLGLNIFCVALSRIPWKLRHIPFLLAHAGILILLFGSWLTEKIGIDGNLRISEGETSNVVELDTASLVVFERNRLHFIPIQWQPPEAKFKPLHTRSYGVPYDFQIDQFISHADTQVSFVPDTSPKLSPSPAAAIQIRMTGGPMRITQDIWLWEGSPQWRAFQAGPAWFSIGHQPLNRSNQPWLSFIPEKDGSLSYVAQSSDGKKVRGRFSNNQMVGQKIIPGWKGNVTFTVTQWIPQASTSVRYFPARIQSGSQAPSSAIHLIATQTVDVWLGLGDRATLRINGEDVEVGYYPKRIILPFSLRLEKFSIEHDQGTMSPASYSSRVSIVDGKKDSSASSNEVTISMNEPLETQDYTIYQASYEEGSPRPTTSIFAVNRDPGRVWKYLGSFFIVLGSVLLFAVKYKRARAAKKVKNQPDLWMPSTSEAQTSI